MISTTDLARVNEVRESLNASLDHLDALIVYARRQRWPERVAKLRTMRARVQNERDALERLFV